MELIGLGTSGSEASNNETEIGNKYVDALIEGFAALLDNGINTEISTILGFYYRFFSSMEEGPFGTVGNGKDGNLNTILDEANDLYQPRFINP